MICRLTKRMLTEVSPRLLWKFASFGWKGMRAVRAFEKRLERGQAFPAFLFLSITDRCNLRCQGCWVTPSSPPRELSLEEMDRIVAACRSQGSSFFGILGGEPLLHPDLFRLMANHPDCYFQLFTNGTLITDDVAAEMRRLGNVTPLISVEGNEVVSDERRGGRGVYGRTLQGLEACRRHRLIIGVATSVCRSNIEDLATPGFVAELVRLGVHYVWYYIYRPVGSSPTAELALTAEQILALRRFLVDIRGEAPIAVVDAYWDHEGRALCPGAVGISHHIGPGGDVEFCPPMQFACESVRDSQDLVSLVSESSFLESFRVFTRKTTQGCVLLDHPGDLRAFLEEQGARDSSGRGTGFDELAEMIRLPCHHMAGQEIPEKHWAYRFAKKNWFFGFGAYG